MTNLNVGTTVDIDNPRDVVEFMERWINRSDRDTVKEVAVGLTDMHRTLQQLFMGFAMEYLNAMQNAPTDARNECAVKAAKAGYTAMVESLNGATRFPLI